jgi:hypothetical protein
MQVRGSQLPATSSRPNSAARPPRPLGTQFKAGFESSESVVAVAFLLSKHHLCVGGRYRRGSNFVIHFPSLSL